MTQGHGHDINIVRTKKSVEPRVETLDYDVASNDLVHNPTYGEGIVKQITDDGKIIVEFQEGEKVSISPSVHKGFLEIEIDVF